MSALPRPFRRPKPPQAMKNSITRHASIESLESRQLLSSAYVSDLLDLTTGSSIDNAAGSLALSSGTYTSTATINSSALTSSSLLSTAPVLPNVKRNYMGDAFDSKGTKLALVIKIRKEDNRGSYASLRGDVRLGTPVPIQILFTSITYGKLRTNLHVDFQFSGSGINGTISGKVSSSGSQIKGVYATSGAYKSSGTFTINKVVGIG